MATVLSFTFTFPFFPLFFKELGIDDPGRAAFITGVSGWALGFGLALFSPIWGVFGDRYGRRLNVVRALALAALVLGLSGFAQNPTQLIMSRFFAGVFGGAGGAMLALVAAGTPRPRIAFATGVMQSAMFVGATAGPVIGGILFDAYGMRVAFFANGIGLAVPALMIQLFVKERFQRPDTPLAGPMEPFRDLLQAVRSRALWPLLITVFLVHSSMLVTFPALPVIVEAVAGPGNAARAAGIVFMAMGLSQAVSAIAMGSIATRVGLKRTFAVLCIGAAALYVPPLFADSTMQLALMLGAVGLFQGGLAGTVNGLVAMASPPGREGAIFGAQQTVLAGAIAFGPLVGGAVAFAIDLRAPFVVNAALFLATAIITTLLVRETRPADARGQATEAGKSTTRPAP